MTEPREPERVLEHAFLDVWEIYDKQKYLEEQAEGYGKWWIKIESMK